MEIQLLGPPAVRHGPAQRELQGRQAALLAGLALCAREPVSADRLVECVWGAEPPRDAANALQQRISRLRAVLDPDRRGDVIVQAGSGYALQVADTQLDVPRFEQLARAGRQQLIAGDVQAAEATLDHALGLWQGPALDGFAHELWALSDVSRLEELRVAVAEDRAEAIRRGGDHERAIAELTELITAHPLRERLRGELMQALYRAGRQADALAAYDESRRLLADELGVDPGPQLKQVHQRILAQDAELTATAAAPPPRGRSNLPTPRGNLIGRDHALEQIAQLLGHVRLLTVTGPGGAGKTSLALEAARRHPTPPQGAWLVELAPVSNRAAVVTTIAGALGLAGGGLGSASIDAAGLVRTLVGRHLLVVLDNCEHLLPAVAPLVEELLAEAADVRVLATSREPLGLSGEVVWSVPGLGVPDEEHTTAEQVLAAPAVQLLVERTRAHSPQFGLTDDTAPAAATLTRRLDGIPLAIELAAARLRVLSLTEATDALDDRFRLLSGRGWTSASRHRTLRAALNWSWDLLPVALQRSWTALAVPADRFDLPTASTLIAAVGVEDDPLDVVADLVDRSLLTADTSATPTRYRMLESVRDYGRERLADLELVDAVRDAHTATVERALTACHAAMTTQCFGVDVDGLWVWLDDARAVLRWADERGDGSCMQRVAGLLGWLWLVRGLSAEGLGWLDRALPSPEDADPATDDPRALLWASALRAAGTRAPDGRRWAHQAVQAAATPIDRILAQVCAAGHHANAGDVQAAAAELDASAREAEATGGWPLGFVRLLQGQVAQATGRLDEARSRTEEAVALLSAAEAEWAHAHGLETLVDEAAAGGEYVRATTLARKGLQLARRQRYPDLEASMLTQLALAAHELGDPGNAKALIDEAVTMAEATGSSTGLADVHARAGVLSRRRGEVAAARAHLHRAAALLASETELDRDEAAEPSELADAAVVDASGCHTGD